MSEMSNGGQSPPERGCHEYYFSWFCEFICYLVCSFGSYIFASSGMLTLMYGFDKTHSISFKSRSYFKRYFIVLCSLVIA